MAMGNFKPIGWTQYPEVIRDYPAALAASLQTRFWSLLARGESQTVLFSKPILLAGGKIAQIGADSQFFPDFGPINPLVTRCYLAGKPKDPRPALPGNGAAACSSRG